MTQDSTLTWKHPNKCQSYNKLFRLKDKILSFLWGDKSCDCDLNVEIIMKCYMKCNSSNRRIHDGVQRFHEKLFKWYQIDFSND